MDPKIHLATQESGALKHQRVLVTSRKLEPTKGCESTGKTWTPKQIWVPQRLWVLQGVEHLHGRGWAPKLIQTPQRAEDLKGFSPFRRSGPLQKFGICDPQAQLGLQDAVKYHRGLGNLKQEWEPQKGFGCFKGFGAHEGLDSHRQRLDPDSHLGPTGGLSHAKVW